MGTTRALPHLISSPYGLWIWGLVTRALEGEHPSSALPPHDFLSLPILFYSFLLLIVPIPPILGWQLRNPSINLGCSKSLLPWAFLVASKPGPHFSWSKGK